MEHVSSLEGITLEAGTDWKVLKKAIKIIGFGLVFSKFAVQPLATKSSWIEQHLNFLLSCRPFWKGEDVGTAHSSSVNAGGTRSNDPFEKCEQPSVFASVCLSFCLQIDHLSRAPVEKPETMHFCLCRVGKRKKPSNASTFLNLRPGRETWTKNIQFVVRKVGNSTIYVVSSRYRWPRWPSVPVHSGRGVTSWRGNSCLRMSFEATALTEEASGCLFVGVFLWDATHKSATCRFLLVWRLNVTRFTSQNVILRQSLMCCFYAVGAERCCKCIQ